ncbi:MAG: hypothetical protein ACKO2G_01275 [Verrucomicrobiales bacterium]
MILSLQRFSILCPAVILLTSLFAVPARAQVDLSITTEKNEYVPYEAVMVNVSITNRSGRPILMASTDGVAPWVKFVVTNEKGENLPRVAEPPPLPPLQLRPGQSISQQFMVNATYPMIAFGGYSIQASVWVPPDRAYASSNKIRVNVIGAREIWSSAFAVPAGRPDGGGTSRIFRLLKLRAIDKQIMYVRLDDRASGEVLACFPAGNSLDFREPSYTIDGDGNLHLLHLVDRELYQHVVVDSSGKLLNVDNHLEVGGSRPVLAAAQNNSIGVLGGRLFDPEVERIRRMSVRKLSERPSGLSELLGGPPPPVAPGGDPNYRPMQPERSR